MKFYQSINLTLILTFLFFQPSLHAEQINFENGAITFDMPAGFSRLKAEEIKLKFPSANAPRFVVGNERRTVTIAYDVKATGMPIEKHVDAELPNAKKEWHNPSIVWFLELNGLRMKSLILMERSGYYSR